MILFDSSFVSEKNNKRSDKKKYFVETSASEPMLCTHFYAGWDEFVVFTLFFCQTDLFQFKVVNLGAFGNRLTHLSKPNAHWISCQTWLWSMENVNFIGEKKYQNRKNERPKWKNMICKREFFFTSNTAKKILWFTCTFLTPNLSFFPRLNQIMWLRATRCVSICKWVFSLLSLSRPKYAKIKRVIQRRKYRLWNFFFARNSCNLLLLFRFFFGECVWALWWMKWYKSPN